jgi:8-oxo-dGTP pyrophosphatase MutT (NUDIX family)
LRLREDQVVDPSGNNDSYAVVEIPPSVGVIALTADLRIALVRQWRYVHKKLSLEIPTGGSAKDETPQAAAQRELTEETGLVARSWTAFGTIDNSNGSTTDIAHLFLATNLCAETERQHQDTEPTEVSWLSFDSAVDEVMRGGITESVSVAAILKVALARTAAQ